MSKYVIARKSHICRTCKNEIPINTLCLTVMANKLKFYHEECYMKTHNPIMIRNPEYKERVKNEL